ncbi:MAG: hypothetical protein PWQ76_407 [Clostridiales bacterium]|jgi:predicted methyltransferase|nr:putative S-adenosylmethionine-dependent methyltransferase involved in cell envelope biosis [Oscillospiraceae bacterium]MDN5378153.1 hypothetical protein [Clostridiales bacterium]
MTDSFSALSLAHKFISENVKPGDFCIDATAGRGNDTAFLCRLVGDSGKVLAFDIQQEAVESTNALLQKEGLDKIGRAILESHHNMGLYAEKESVSCITFNFGWLPGGNHKISTRPETSIKAIEAGLELLKPDGVMSLCIYYGRDTGFEERDALLEYFKTIDCKRFTVLVSQFANRPNCPPFPVFIYKGR